MMIMMVLTSSYSTASNSWRCAPLKNRGSSRNCLTGTKSMIIKGKKTPAMWSRNRSASRCSGCDCLEKYSLNEYGVTLFNYSVKEKKYWWEQDNDACIFFYFQIQTDWKKGFKDDGVTCIFCMEPWKAVRFVPRTGFLVSFQWPWSQSSPKGLRSESFWEEASRPHILLPWWTVASCSTFALLLQWATNHLSPSQHQTPLKPIEW